MMNLNPAFPLQEHAIRRLAALAPLGDTEVETLARATAERKKSSSHRELLGEREPDTKPGMILSGWACRTRTFRDGRRQILSFLLPGDLIGFHHQPAPVSMTSIYALTEVTTCTLPRPAERTEGMLQAFTISGALEEFYLFRQIARLGRLNAYERMVDWLLEMHERLQLAGISAADSFPMPLTQEVLADALGLTSVHVNRTLQSMRRDGLVDIRGGRAKLIDPQRLALISDRRPTIVSSIGR